MCARTGDSIAAPELMQTVNVAVQLSRPPLINGEPGIESLRRLRGHFDYSVWLNTTPADEWDRAYGSTTMRLVREVFPMFELTVDGLTAATKKLMVRYWRPRVSLTGAEQPQGARGAHAATGRRPSLVEFRRPRADNSCNPVPRAGEGGDEVGGTDGSREDAASATAEARYRHLTAMLESSRALGSTMVLEEVLQVLAEHVGKAIDAASSFIYEYLPDQEAVIWRCQYQRDGDRTYDDPVGTVYPLDFFPVDLRVVHDREIVVVTVDDPDLDPKSREDMVSWDETTMLSVPLVYGDEIVGLMELCETEYVRQYTDDEIELVRAIGEQAAVAIRNAQLFRREAWRNERLVRVLDISQVVGGSLDPDEVVDVVGSRLGRLFGERETSVTVDLYGEGVLGSAQTTDEGAKPAEADDSGGRLVVPLVSKGKSIGDLTVTSPLPQPFERDETEFVQIIANQVAVAIENARLYDRLEEQAITDGLTGLYNHRFFYDRLTSEVARARRYGFQLSLLMLDLDDFKGFNDEFGHQAGDHVLAEVGRIMREQLRKDVDIPCRYGGEEFAIMLPHTPSPGAETVGRRLTEQVSAILTAGGGVDPAWLTGERVRRSIEGAPFPGRQPDETTHITVSVGIATYPDQAGDAQTLVANADKALYVAKHRGKNRVELFG